MVDVLNDPVGYRGKSVSGGVRLKDASHSNRSRKNPARVEHRFSLRMSVIIGDSSTALPGVRRFQMPCPNRTPENGQVASDTGRYAIGSRNGR